MEETGSNFSEINTDWFAFETKIRKVIAELFEKNIQRSFQDKKTLIANEKELNSHKHRIDTLEKVIFSEKGEPAIFTKFWNSIAKTNADRKAAEKRLEDQILKVNDKTDDLYSKLKLANLEIQKHDRQFEVFRTDFGELRETVIENRTLLTRKVDELNDELHNKMNETKMTLKQNAEKIKSAFDELALLKTKCMGLESNRQIDSIKLDRMKNDLIELEHKKLDTEDFNKRQLEIEGWVNYAKGSIEDVSNTLKSTDNYLDKYMPFKVINIISEIMRPVFQSQQILEE